MIYEIIFLFYNHFRAQRYNVFVYASLQNTLLAFELQYI